MDNPDDHYLKLVATGIFFDQIHTDLDNLGNLDNPELPWDEGKDQNATSSEPQ